MLMTYNNHTSNIIEMLKDLKAEWLEFLHWARTNPPNSQYGVSSSDGMIENGK